MGTGALGGRRRQGNAEILGRKPVQLPTALCSSHLEVTWTGLELKPDIHGWRQVTRT